MAFIDDECDFLVRDNSCLLFQFDKNPFDLLKDQRYDDTEIKCSDYLMEVQSNEVETQSNSDKKSSPKHKNKEITNKYMDFEENLKPKKRQKKIFGVVIKSDNLLDQMLEKTRKSSDPNSFHETEPVFSKSQLMRIKRIQQKKLLEKTRGKKRQFSKTEKESDCEKKKKENISKKKKALQNRISAQKSIEKKKTIINQIKSEKELLSNENENLKIELDRKNREIEQLRRTLLSSQKDNSIYNFNFTVARTSSKFFGNSIACIILFICLLQCYYNPSVSLENSNPIHGAPIYQPMVKYSRRQETRQINQYYISLKEKLNMLPTHQKTNQKISDLDTNLRGCVYRRYFFYDRCGIDARE